MHHVMMGGLILTVSEERYSTNMDNVYIENTVKFQVYHISCSIPFQGILISDNVKSEWGKE